MNTADGRKRLTLGTADMFGQNGPDADVVYTPDWCAADMVRHFRPQGRILEPCRGGGAFMRHLPDDTEWCEIRDGRDFFAWRGQVDWVITNPPYTQTRPFFQHAKTLADNIVFLLPVRNVFAGYGFVREVVGWGGMAEIRWYGRGDQIGLPMGNAVGAIHWKKGHFGRTIRESSYEDDMLAQTALRAALPRDEEQDITDTLDNAEAAIKILNARP